MELPQEGAPKRPKLEVPTVPKVEKMGSADLDVKCSISSQQPASSFSKTALFESYGVLFYEEDAGTVEDLLEPVSDGESPEVEDLLKPVSDGESPEVQRTVVTGVPSTSAPFATDNPPSLDALNNESELKESMKDWITNISLQEHTMIVLETGERERKNLFSDYVASVNEPQTLPVVYPENDHGSIITKGSKSDAEHTMIVLETGERERKNLFSDYVAFVNEPQTPPVVYPKNDHGSIITKGSKSDAAFVNKTTFVLFEAEYKNASNFNKKGAKNQLKGYLYSQLWWWRTFMGLDVREVCGFTVCGPKCADNDTKELQISIVVLSLPTKIGGQFLCRVFDAETMHEGLEALKKVFRHQFYDLNKLGKEGNKLIVKSPGEMMKPAHLWGDHVWETIPNGSGNLVLRFTPGDKDGNTGQERKNMAKEYFKHLDCRKRCRERINRFIEGAENPIYIKIKNRASAVDWASSKVTKLHWDENLKHWEKLYPKNFYFENDYNTVILMNHVGTRLDEVENLGIETFCTMYLQMMKETLRVGEHCRLVHGDIHKGNLLYDGEKMWLIDWDEAITLGARTNRAETGESERYPCFGQSDSDNLLTKVQLFVLFRDLVKDLYDKVVWVESKQNVNEGFTELILKVDDAKKSEKTAVSLKGIDNEKISKRKEHRASKYYKALERYLEEQKQEQV